MVDFAWGYMAQAIAASIITSSNSTKPIIVLLIHPQIVLFDPSSSLQFVLLIHFDLYLCSTLIHTFDQLQVLGRIHFLLQNDSKVDQN